MAIVEADIEWRLSVKTGSAGNSVAGTPAGSLGKYMSTTQVSGTPLNNLFDDISGDENAAEDVEYRCIFVYNDHATLTYQGAVVWLSAETGGGANIAIAIDNEPDSPDDQAADQAEEIADESTAPTAVGAFSSPTTKGAGLSLGDIAPVHCRAIWVRRTATNSAALDDDGVTIAVEGDTAA